MDKDKAKPKNIPLGAKIVEEAAAKNIQKRTEQAAKKESGVTVDSDKPAVGKLEEPAANATNAAINETRTTAPPKKTKGVIGAKGVKLQPIQAKLKPNLYAMHQETIDGVNKLTDSNITSADVMRASVYLLSKIKPDKILQAIKETAI